MERPNVLFLMSDEHRADAAGFAGNNIVRTPTLDWLASTGTVFTNAYTPSPICIPGRQAIMSGQFPRTCGVETFGQDLPPFSLTFARRLAQNGYRTICCGKLHHTGEDQMQGWTDRPAGDLRINPNFIKADFAPDSPPAENGTGKWSNHKELQQAGVYEGFHVEGDTTWTESALSEIDRYFCNSGYDRPSPQVPLMLKLSLLQPHYPYFCSEELFRYYLNRVEPFVDQPRMDHPKLGFCQDGSLFDPTHRDARRATAAYYGMIETVDTHYGKVLQRLKDVGQDLDDWIIVYTTDHGEMLGEHGIWEKSQFYEASAKVPLIIRLPEKLRKAWGAEGNTIDANVNLCDLFATLCELTSSPLPKANETVNTAGLDSRSLVPLFQGKTQQWQSEYSNETISQFKGEHVMIKRDALKYCYYGDDKCKDYPEVLFDLKKDPGESMDYINDPSYTDVLKTLRARRKELGFD